MANVYEIVTDRIIKQLEQGTVPWRKPWSGEQFHPTNGSSKRPYRGINVFLLACTEFSSPFWLTFRQAKQLGGTVKKGEKSLPIVFWKWREVEDEETGLPVERPILRYYSVFNVMQCDLPKDKIPSVPEIVRHDFIPIERCEAVVQNMPQKPQIEYDTLAAFYRPSTDKVHMPAANRFESPEEFYSTLYHEIVHASGHRSRLNRDGIVDAAPYGSHTHSKEELIAEMGAAFLCGHCGIEQATIENSAAYINGWLKKLKGDSRLVVQAASAAQKAADFILDQSYDNKAED